MNWDESMQLRHAAQCSSLKDLCGGGRADILELEKELRNLGYDGMVAGMDAEAIVQGWKEKSWIKISPSGFELRLTETGIEQFAKWDEEDALWDKGEAEEIKFVKRLKAGEPAKNLLKVVQIIAGSTLTAVHDPYIDEKALETLHKLTGLGADISKDLRLLNAPMAAKKTESIKSFLAELNAEIGSNWQLRASTAVPKPHRRFLILQDGSVVTCGLSLNNIDKDEALDRLSVGSELADYDLKFFENSWESGKPL
jgi:hypothetical protein